MTAGRTFTWLVTLHRAFCSATTGTALSPTSGLESGVALNEHGNPQAGMGVGIGDYNLDGHLDIFKTHFSDDTNILYKYDGKGFFEDVTLASGLAVETRFVGWGA